MTTTRQTRDQVLRAAGAVLRHADPKLMEDGTTVGSYRTDGLGLYLGVLMRADEKRKKDARARSYAELWFPIGKRPTFPGDCPVCGEERFECVEETDGYGNHATYRCGGTFTMKSQIQNHTDKYWGHCEADLPLAK